MHVRLQSLPTLTCRISGRPRLSEIECSASFCANLFILDPAATAAVAAFAVRLGCSVVILAFRFLRMAECRSRTIERLCLSQRHLDDRVDEFEELAIGRFPVEIVSLIANRVAPAAFHSVIVAVVYFV